MARMTSAAPVPPSASIKSARRWWKGTPEKGRDPGRSTSGEKLGEKPWKSGGVRKLGGEVRRRERVRRVKKARSATAESG